MLGFLLSLFGCKKSPGASATSSALGPFTLETIVTKGKTWNMNYGRVPYTRISYEVKYKGQSLQFGDSLETNTGLPGIWRVFLLRDAPKPTLLLGSQSLYLVTLEGEKPAIRPLHVQSSDFASVQWLDSEQGQPGIYREIYSSDELDRDSLLAGGRYLAISGAAVLDTKTLELFPFNTNNEWIDGYSTGQRRAIAFSPDSTQVVFCGQKQDAVDYMKTLYACLCYDFRTASSYAVPFDAEALYMKMEERIDEAFISDHFTWVKDTGGSYRLEAKNSPVPHKGSLFYARYAGYQYILDPVQEEMIEKLFAYIREQLHLDMTGVVRTTEQYNDKYLIPYQGTTLRLEYGQYGNDLVLIEADPKLSYEQNKELLGSLGKGFNALLGQGKYQDLFLPFRTE